MVDENIYSRLKKIQILVCAHKKDPNIRNEYPYKAIQVGKALHPKEYFGYLCDNEGDNISEKNSSYSEWTALHWGWKNIHDTKYLGLCHYRRYFDIDITDESIEKIMKNCDMIVIKQTYPMISKSERPLNLMIQTSKEDYYIFLDTLLEIHSSYKREILNYFYNSRTSFPYSMFIARKELFDEFCEFIFPVLFSVEEKIKKHGYTRQRRVMGYLGEYSLGLFIACKHLRYYSVPLKFYSDKEIYPKNLTRYYVRKLKQFLWRYIYRIKEIGNSVPDETSLLPEDVKVGLKNDNIEMKVLQ